jgi:hypothetical protein
LALHVISLRTQRLWLVASLAPYLVGALGWGCSILWASAFQESPTAIFSPARLLAVMGWYIGWFASLGVSLGVGVNLLAGHHSRTMHVALFFGGAYAVLFGACLVYLQFR